MTAVSSGLVSAASFAGSDPPTSTFMFAAPSGAERSVESALATITCLQVGTRLAASSVCGRNASQVTIAAASESSR
jgi:hypothetical protein